MTLDEYKALEAKRVGKRRGRPEHDLQCGWVKCLHEVLPPEVVFTASAAGVYLTPKVRRDMKDAGLMPDWADLQFLFPDGITRYVEAKTPTGDLEPGQRKFRDRLEPFGRWALARCWDDLEAALAGWCAECGLTLRPLHPLTRARYAR